MIQNETLSGKHTLSKTISRPDLEHLRTTGSMSSRINKTIAEMGRYRTRANSKKQVIPIHIAQSCETQ